MQRKGLDFLHRLFDPRPHSSRSQDFALRHPPQSAQQASPDISVHTALHGPDDNALLRVKVHSQAALEQIDSTLQILNTDLDTDADINLGRLKVALHAARGSDIMVRSLTLPCTPSRRAHVVYIDGITNTQIINQFILQPLADRNWPEPPAQGVELLRQVDSRLVPGHRSKDVFQLGAMLEGVVSGECVLLLDTVPGALLVDVRQLPGRNVDKPQGEPVGQGPHEAFTEVLRVNTALLRRRLATPNLVFEQAMVGRQSRTLLNIAYLSGVVNEDLLAEVRRRVARLDVDNIQDSGTLQNLLQDTVYTPFPTIGSSERPDRAAASISEGRIAILVDGSPYVLLVPWLFGDFFHYPEDYYINWPFASALRIIRMLGAMTALALPALYISIANFHHEMIPSELLLAIAASREAVPFPAAIEVLMMEVAFEIIREGSLRVPTILGQTIGIVGALILGQAAVQAGIVSSILVIVVAITGLGSFTIPHYGMSLAFRLLRFGLMFLATGFGLYGVAAGLFALSAVSSGLRSFGVPFMAPAGPRFRVDPDTLLLGPIHALDQRPAMLFPRDRRRQEKHGLDEAVPVTAKDGRRGGVAPE